MKNTELIPYKYSVSEIHYNLPNPNENCYKGTVSEIQHAWRDCGFLDDAGHVWISTDKIHSILRTTRGYANHRIAEISEDNKKTINNKTYIRGYKLGELIDQIIQDLGAGTRQMYLKYSEQIYYAIRDSDKAKSLRMEFAALVSVNKKILKPARIKKYKIKYDELTGQKLKKKTCEFSHIRSFALFPQLGDDIENGLIVNKATHDIITKYGIANENELYDICKKNNWSTSWYEKFIDYFKVS